MANTAEIKAVITADDRASRVLEGFGGKISHVAKDAAIAIGAVSVAAISFGAASIKAFSESQDVIEQTNAVLKSTGGIAGVTADEVSSLAASLQKVTKFSDETIQSGENLLLTFTNIGKDIFPQATEIMLDMSQALGQDVKSSAIQLGKALQDPILGVTALHRVGVNFNKAQADVIKNLVETGKAGEAQALILKELQTEFGNSAKAAGSTFSGKLAQLKNSFNDVQESIGKTLVEGLTPLADRLATFVQSEQFQAWLEKLTTWLRDNLPKALNWVINVGMPNLIEIAKELWPVIKTVWDMFSGFVKFLIDHEWVLYAIVAGFVAIKGAMALQGALEAFKGVMAGATLVYQGFAALIASPLALPAIAIGAALIALWKVRDAALEAWQAIKNAQMAKEGLAQSNKVVLKNLQAQTQAPYSVEVQNRAKATIAKLAASGQFDELASGTDFARGGPTLVGERGPELVNMPRGAQVIPNNKLGGMGATINVSFSGIFTGNQQEFRKLAIDVFRAYDDAKGMGTI